MFSKLIFLRVIVTYRYLDQHAMSCFEFWWRHRFVAAPPLTDGLWDLPSTLSDI